MKLWPSQYVRTSSAVLKSTHILGRSVDICLYLRLSCTVCLHALFPSRRTFFRMPVTSWFSYVQSELGVLELGDYGHSGIRWDIEQRLVFSYLSGQRSFITYQGKNRESWWHMSCSSTRSKEKRVGAWKGLRIYLSEQPLSIQDVGVCLRCLCLRIHIARKDSECSGCTTAQGYKVLFPLFASKPELNLDILGSSYFWCLQASIS